MPFHSMLHILVLTQSLLWVAEEISLYEDMAQDFVTAVSSERQVRRIVEADVLSLNAAYSVNAIVEMSQTSSPDIIAMLQRLGWSFPIPNRPQVPVATTDPQVFAIPISEVNRRIPRSYPNWRAHFVEETP